MLCDNLEGWDGVGVRGREDKREDICIFMADSCYSDRNQHSIVK